MDFQIILGIVAVIAGGIATISGFGIGSILTPLLALKTGTSVAVAGVAIAHFLGTALRFILWRKHLNKRILISFGITSAIGGLIGAFLHNVLFNTTLTIIFGCLLIFAGITVFTGMLDKLHLSDTSAWIAGVFSGFFGGLVGNQGGIRSAAMLGFKLNQKEFVATATAIALVVDAARIPVYITVQRKEMAAIWEYILIATIGVFIGTIAGGWILKKIPEKSFKKTVAVIIFLIGILVVIHK